MSDKSAIEWTDATWNPVRGCSIVSKGCTNCYAMKVADRFSGEGGAYEGLTKHSKGGPVWTGEVRMIPQLLDQPLRWRKPRRIFVNSMSDLFHEAVDAVFIGSVLGIAAACPQHTFQVLTKRAARMREVLTCAAFLEAYESSLAMYTDADVPWPAPNVWLGVSVEDQAAADERIPPLLQTPAAVRWISAEPLLGPVDLIGFFPHCLDGHPFPALCRDQTHRRTGIEWVVAGGESGRFCARPMHPDWARLLRDQCAAAGVPYFFKQWGEHYPAALDSTAPEDEPWRLYPNGERRWSLSEIVKPRDQWPPIEFVALGKKATGRELDGRTHDEYPT